MNEHIKDETLTPLPSFGIFVWRVIAMHMGAYIIAGTLAQLLFNYEKLMQSDTLSLLMRPYDSSMVALGPALQLINGFFMGVILYRIRKTVLEQKNGWLTLFLIVAGFSIFAPQAPAPGTFEGFIYTKITIMEHFIGLPECFLYSFLFSFGLITWFKKSGKAWNIITGIIVSLMIIISALGYLASIGIIRQP